MVGAGEGEEVGRLRAEGEKVGDVGTYVRWKEVEEETRSFVCEVGGG